MFSSNNFVTGLFITIVTVLITAVFYIKNNYKYWTRKGVAQLSPVFPFGDYFKALPRGISLGAYSIHYYNEFKRLGQKIGGIYLGLDPYLVIIDEKYAKDVLTKDFQYFVDRGIYLNEKNPITVNILTQGGEDWRKTRAKFSCMFTSAKMKYFFHTMKSCIGELKANLEYQVEHNDDIDIYEVMACYFTDIIGSAIFGVDAHSFQQTDSVSIRKLGRDLFGSFSKFFQFKLFLTICYARIAKFLGLSHIQPEIEKFFFDFIPDAIEFRRKNNIQRADFLQILIDLKDSGVTLTEQEIVSQAFLFFSAGFETSSGSSTFLLYELALHPEVQQKAREEINTICKKYDGDINYDALLEMKYLDQIFNETARKYPALTTLNRVCVNDYQFANSDVVIEKGTGVILPVLGYHRNPDIFPDPMKFDPDRFEDKNVKYDGYFPFGDGPRNCIGGRFGLMQVKLGLSEIIRNYQISVSPKTSDSIIFDEYTFVTRPIKPVLLRLKKLKVND